MKKCWGPVQDRAHPGKIELTDSIETLEVNPMAPRYLKALISSISRIIELRIDRPAVRYSLLCLLTRFLSCRSIFEIALYYGIPKDRLYRGNRKIKSLTQLMAIRRNGSRELFWHLEKIKKMSPASKSRLGALLCADDASERTRGKIGGLTSLGWNGGEKKVIPGVNCQCLVAVLGESEKVVLLDVRVVLPGHTGPGKQPLSRNEWLGESVERLEGSLKSWGQTLKGCRISVDRAYVSKPVLETMAGLGIPLISQVHGGRILTGTVFPGLTLKGKAAAVLGTWFRLNESSLKPLGQERGLEYLRTTMESKALGRLTILARKAGKEVKFFFSTDPSVKAITIHRAARRRWKLERIFWDWKQRIGMGDVHHSAPDRFIARWYQQLILLQSIKDASRELKVPLPIFIRTLRKDCDKVFFLIRTGRVFSHPPPQESVPVLKEAA